MITIIVVLLLITGCSSFLTGYRTARALNKEADTDYQKTDLAVDGYDIHVVADDAWERRPDEDTPYDLQCIYNGDEAYASFFYYYYIDLPMETTPYDIFQTQIKDIMDKRDHVETIEEESIRKIGDKTITSKLLSAERDGSKNYYYANLVEFGETADQFAWVMFTSMPSDMKSNRAVYDQLLENMQYEREENLL